MDIEKLKDELMLSKVTHRFSFTRDEVMELIGVNTTTALELIRLRQQIAKPAPEAQILIDALRDIVNMHPHSSEDSAWNMIDTAKEALDEYSKATPDNGVEKLVN
jgi:hypothetical protein